MTQSAMGYLRRQYLCVLRRCALRNAMMTLGACMVGGGTALAQIVPDGRTQTQVSVSGSVTDISTQTVRGANAYNSFQTFNVNTGQTVNLYLPGQTSNLLNLVHGERSYINGLLNSYQNGQIGGNVYFFNPYGLIVGAQGVINVGSLTLSTPTAAFMNQLISPQGVIDGEATANALAGRIPLSPTGLVQIWGRIRAADAVTIAAGQIDIASGAQVLAGGQAKVEFQNLVNIDNVPMAAGLRLDGGVVRLLAAGDINVAGQVSADGVGADAHGGRVEIMADQKATLKSGAVVSANAGSSGDGGFVEFSAKQEVELAGGSLQASAVQGVAGSVLIDPANITISADLLRSGSNPSGGGTTWNAGSLTLQADDKVSVADGVVISTRAVAGGTRNDHINGASTGASGNLTIKAAHIELGDGSMLLAQGGNGHAGGDVSLIAQDINAIGGDRSANASITATNATIKGANVTLKANADTSAIVTLLEQAPNTTLADAQTYVNSEADDPSDGPGGEYLAVKTDATATTTLRGVRIDATGDVTIAASAGARAGFEKNARATVTIDDHQPTVGPVVASHISGRNVSIKATTDTSMTFNVLGTALKLADQSWLPSEDSGEVQLLNDQLFDFSSVPLVSLSESHAAVNIGGASKVEATQDLDVQASSTAAAKPTFASPLLFSAAWGESNASARLTVDGTSLLRAGDAATLGASTEVELNVSATVNSTNKPIDAVFARGLSTIDTSVSIGNNTTTDAGSLAVKAETKADITVLADAKNTGGSGLGIGIAVNESTSTTTATLGGTVTTSTGDVSVSATTDVEQNNTSANAATLGNPSSLSARMTNFKAGIQRNVTSSILGATGKLSGVNADKLSSFMFPGIKEGKFNASGAVAWADSSNTANASIAANASVRSAGALTVEASVTEAPNASATAQSTSTGTAIGGSAVIANFGNHANAWIGANAQVDAQGATHVDAQTLIPYPWQINWNSPAAILNHLQGNLLDLVLTGYTINSAKGKDGLGIAAGVSLLGFDNNANAWIAEGAQVNQRTNTTATPALNLSQQSVAVTARNEVNLVTAAGIASKKFLGTTGGKGAIGGVASILDIGGNATASIHDGANVRAAQTVDVSAASQHHLVSVTEAGGSSESITIEGAVSIITMNTDTVAAIDDKARVVAGGNVTVEAESDLRTIAIAGGVAVTKGPVGIGMSVSLNSIDNTVMALIGNRDTVNDTAPATGTIATGGDLLVQATASTEIGSYSVAGAIATSSKGQTEAPSGSGDTNSGGGSAAGGGAGSGKFGIAMSGDASVNEITANTTAELRDGVRVTQADDVTVQAQNTLAIEALSGAVSISTQANGNGIAGSFAMNTLNGTTAARLQDATVDMGGDLSMQAGVDGSIRTLSASLAGAKGKLGVAGSVSINEIANTTEALLANTSINGAGNVLIGASDSSTIQSVAGAVAFGGKAGVGLSFAWNKIDNTTRALVDTSDIDASGTVTVEAEADNAIDSISASIGASKGPMAGAGAVSINEIGNTTSATVQGKKTTGIDATGAIAVKASDNSDIFAVTGGVGATSGQAGFGASVAWSEVNNTVAAKATQGARLDSQNGAVQIQALSDTGVQAVAVAGAAADKVAVAGSFSAVQTHNTTLAEVSGGSVVDAGGAVTVSAADTARIESLAGSVAVSANAAIGVAAAYNVIDNDTTAKVVQSTVGGNAVAIQATTDADIASAAVGGGGGSKVAVTGSLAINTIGNQTTASASNSALTATGLASVTASDSSTIGSLSGAAAVGGKGAVGASGSYNHINGEVLAEISGGSVNAANLTVDAQRRGELEVWAISGSGAGTAGFAGSIAVNDVGGSNTARIHGGAVVQANGNALVTAQSDDEVKSRAGAVGLGGSLGGSGAVAINDMHAATTAEVSGTGTRVTAWGNGAAAQVDNGQLGANGSLDARQQQDALRGVAVVASSTAELENIAVSAAGGGSAAVAATVSVALMGGSTTAQLSDGAQLNSTLGNAAQQARVAAFHHDAIVSGTGGGAVGGNAGVGGAVDTITVSHTTTARVQNADAQARQALAVQARSTNEITQAAVAVGGGAYAGLAGTGALVLLDSTTQALVNNADLASQGSLSVLAEADTSVDIVAGALAISGAVGVGVTAAVTVSEQHTTARVDGNSTLNANGSTQISADTAFEQTNHAYTAAAAGGAGVAGTVSVLVAKGSTEASLGGTASINADSSYSGATQDVFITALDTTTIGNRLGSLGVGGVGVGAVADVILVNSGASASVGSATSIQADRNFELGAVSQRDIDSLTTAAAGGYTAGIAGAVSVISVGARPDGDARDNTSSSVDKAGQMVSGSATGDQMAADNNGGNASAQRANAARASVSLNGDFNAAQTASSAAATVASGANLNAGGSVNVLALNQTTTNAIAVGAAISGGISLGGAVAIAMVDDRTLATLAGNTTAGGSVLVQARDAQNGASTLRTYAGGAGLAGLAASVAWHDKSSTAQAQLGGTVVASGTVTVRANLDHELNAIGGAGAAGVLGVGAAIANVEQNSATSADLLDNASVSAAGLLVASTAITNSAADVVAAAGGLVAGAVGAKADVTDNTQALAAIGDGTFIRTGAGTVQVHAEVNPFARAESLGVAVSAGLSIGASLADAQVNTVARATTGNNVDIAARGVDVFARTWSTADTAVAKATAAAGGLLLGASATEASAGVNATTDAALGNHNEITATGELAVRALSTTSAKANAAGINVGLLAAGSNTALARTNTQTLVSVGDAADLVVARLSLQAQGNDTLRASTVSGAGGLGALIASKAETDADALSTVRLGTAAGTGGTVVANTVDIDAVQQVNFDASADSTSAAAVGASGARAINHVDTQALAAIGQNMTVAARDLFSARAGNDIDKSTASATGYNVDSGSGGVLNAAAAQSSSNIRNDAQVTVGTNALIGVNNNAVNAVLNPSGQLVNVPVNGLLELAAWNDVAAYDRVRLDSGGAIAIARAESTIDNVNTAKVTVGDASLMSDGNIELSARTSAVAQTRANSKTYGLAGAAEGTTRSTIVADQAVQIGTGAFLEAQESVHLMAGTDRAQTNNLNADAETRLWNRTAIPIETDPQAHGQVVQDNDVTIAQGAQVRAVRDVHLTATEGTHNARGFGEGTDLYREVLAALAEFFGADSSALKITGGSRYDNADLVAPAGGPSSHVQVDGSARAGIWSQQWITIAADGSITTSESLGGMATKSDGQNVAQLLQQEINDLEDAADRKRDQYNNFKGGSAAATAIDNQAAAVAQRNAAQLALTAATDTRTDIKGFTDTARNAGTGAAAAAAAATNAANLAAAQAATNTGETGSTAGVKVAAAATASATAAGAASAAAAATAATQAESAASDLNNAATGATGTAKTYLQTMAAGAQDAATKARAVATALAAEAALPGNASAGDRAAAATAVTNARTAANTAAKNAAIVAAIDADTVANQAVTSATTWLSTSETRLTQANSDVLAAQNAGSSSDAALGMYADAQFLSSQLAQMQGATNVNFVDIGSAGDIITARSGNVRVTGKALTGQGDLFAPGDAKIEIKNESTRFMRVNADLVIPDEGGGQVTFNGMRVSSSNDINLRNAAGHTANLGVTDALNTAKPLILVENTNANNSGNAGGPAQLWLYGNISNLGGEAKATSHGTMRVAGNISAETVSLATGGDFIKTWTPGYTHQGGDPIARLGALPGQKEATKADYSQNGLPDCATVACGSTIAGNNVYISAEKLNINGLIQAGLPERGIEINNTLLSAANVTNPALTNTQAITAARAAWQANPSTAQRYIDLTNPTADGIADSGAIKLRYDAQNDRLELADVRMGGGHMELFGDIFSTGNGELRVMDGYGRINITNSTNYDLAVGRLDTGPGVEGMIRITDTARDAAGNYRGSGNTPLVTEITRVNGTATTRTNSGANGAMVVVKTSTTSDGRETTFDPMLNRRFNWINAETTNWQRIQTYKTKSTWGSDLLARDPGAQPDQVFAPSSVYVGRVSGDWLSIVATQGADYTLDYANTLSTETKTSLPTTSYKTDCFWGVCHSRMTVYTEQYNWTQSESYQHSLNASQAVAVKFTGYDTSQVKVDTTGQLVIGGLVRSVAGDITINATEGISSANADAKLLGAEINLTSAAGAIGTAAAPVRIELVNGGALTASGRDGVSVATTRGDLLINSVMAAQGDVNLSADGHIRTQAAGTAITGQNISLVSLNGGIHGLMDNLALQVETLGTDSTLSARAAGDIRLEETTGDMRIRQVASVAGDVVLTTPGRLLDANTVEQVDEKTRTELLALWAEMGLTGAQADDALARNLATQKTQLQQQYENYYRMRNLKRQDNGTFTADAYNPNFQFHLTPVQASSLQSVNPGWGATELANYEAQQTAAYHAANARFGSGGYVANYQPTLSTTETAALSEGFKWEDKELANGLAAGLFRPTSDTDIRLEEANVIGRHVTLSAQNGIGMQHATPAVITLDASGLLSDEHKLILMTAERSDITVDGHGQISVKQFEDLDVTVTGTLNASTTTGSALLGSEANLTIGQVSAVDEVRIKTGASLLGAAGQTNVVANTTVLEAGLGQIGSSAADPFTVDLGPTGTLTARAGTDLFIREVQGDMVVNAVFAKGDATLDAQGSIVEARPDKLLDVRATSVTLTAGDTVGKPGGDNALDVQVRKPGVLSASAPNGIYLNTIGGSGALGNITTQGQFNLSSGDGSITLGGTVQADAGVELTAVDDIRFEGGNIRTNGNVGLRAGTDGTGSITRTGGAGPDVRALGSVFASAPDALGGPSPLRVVSGGPLTLQGRLIDVALSPVVPGAGAVVHVTGIGGGVAQDVNLDVRGAGDLQLNTFVIGNALVTTDAATLGVPAGYVGDAATFVTPFFTARIDHQDRPPAPDGTTVRGFTLNGDFTLNMTPTNATVGAYVINYDLRRHVAGTPAGSAQGTIGESLLSTSAKPDDESLAIGSEADKEDGKALININLDGLDKDL